MFSITFPCKTVLFCCSKVFVCLCACIYLYTTRQQRSFDILRNVVFFSSSDSGFEGRWCCVLFDSLQHYRLRYYLVFDVRAQCINYNLKSKYYGCRLSINLSAHLIHTPPPNRAKSRIFASFLITFSVIYFFSMLILLFLLI